MLPVLLLCALLLTALPVPAYAAGEAGLELKQNSIALAGITTVSVSAKRVVINNAGVLIYSAAPDWELFFVRPARKEWISIPYETVRKMSVLTGVMGNFNTTAGLKNPTVNRLEKKGGYSFHHFEYPGEKSKSFFLSSTVPSDELDIRFFELVSLDENLPVQPCTILRKLYGWPDVPGIPFTSRAVKTTGFAQTLITVGSKRITEVRAQTFPLAKFTKVKRLNDVWNTSAASDVLKDMLE